MYGASAVADYSVTLWDSLKYEILYVQEENLAHESLIALKAISTRLGHDRAPAELDTYLTRYIRPIIQECNEKLQEPQQKQVKPMGEILRSTASGSPVALYMIIKAVLPPLLTFYQKADTIARRKVFLEVLIQILDAAKSLNQATESMPSLIDNDSPLHIYKDRLFELFQQALMSSSNTEISYRVVALRGLLGLCQIRWYVEDSEIALSVQCFDDVLLDGSHEWSDLKDEAVQALVEISKFAPSMVTDKVLPTFLARLPDSSGSDQKEYMTILESLARLGVERSISETLIRRLLNKLMIVLQAADFSDYPQAILSTLNFLLTGRDLAHDPLLNTYYEALVVNLIKRAAMASVNCDPSVALTDSAMLETIGRLAGKIVKSLDEDKRRSVALQVYTLFTDDKTPFVPLLYPQELPHRQRQTIILSAWLLGTIGVVVCGQYPVRFQWILTILGRRQFRHTKPNS